MFNSNDFSYKQVPKTMSMETSKRIIDSLCEYLKEGNVQTFTLIIHGGEPFLWHFDNYNFLFDYVAKKNEEYNLQINIIVQTNGFLINSDLVNLFIKYKIPLGISIDGPKELHDKYRITHNNKPSYNKIIKNLYSILEWGYDRNLIGLLSVVDPTFDVQSYFNWIKTLPINRINVLWPIEFNYNNTPWDYFHLEKDFYIRNPLYGKWFADLFSIWFREDDPDIFIKSFYEIITLKLGSKSHSDSLVNDELAMLVIDTNGDIEYHDYFRAFKDGSIKTSYTIFKDKIRDVENDLIFAKCLHLKHQLPRICTHCEQVAVCGGGFLPGRMKDNVNDFSRYNSILCYDQKYFFEKINSILNAALLDVNNASYSEQFQPA